MNTALVHVEQQTHEAPFALTPAQARLRQMVLDSVPSLHSKRNYAKALDDLFTFCASRPLSRALKYDGSRIINPPSAENLVLNWVPKFEVLGPGSYRKVE
jgi:hypothetical protein